MIITRRAAPDDLRFIHSSWLRSYWESGAAPKVDYKTYHDGFGAIVDNLAPSSLVAAFEAAPTEIAGYVVREGPIVHWVYVKHVYRRQGIAEALLHGAKEFTLCTKAGKELAQRLQMHFNPWAVTKGKR